MLFNSFTSENGLSGSNVNCLLQDKTGFIWIGTDNGLNRFDGKEFKVYKHSLLQKNTISDNSIWALSEDKDGCIWIGTKQGILNKFNPYTQIFTQVDLGLQNTSEIGITSIIHDKEGVIWVGTYSQGLLRFDPKNNLIKHWTAKSNSHNEISNKYITSLTQDSDGYIWISTYYGLNKIDPRKLESGFIKYFYSANDQNSICNNLVWRVIQSTENKKQLWIGTANGICIYNLESGKFSRFDINPDYQLQFNKSFAIVVEQQIANEKILWAATYGGLYKINLSTNKSEQFISDKKNSNGLLSNQIDQLLIDKSGVLWIATDKGLNFLTQKNQRFNKLVFNISSNSVIDEIYKADIKSVLSLENDLTFIAAEDALYKVNILDNKINAQGITSISNVNYWSLERGLQNNIWIGTYGNGLIKYDLKSNKPRFIKIENSKLITLAYNYIKTLCQSNDGTLWIGFWGGGIAKYNTSTDDYEIYRNDENDPNSLSYNDIWDIHQDKLGRIWIGTYGGGLNLYIPGKQQMFKSFKFDNQISQSLTSNSVIMISEVPSEKENEVVLMIGTENGLNKVTVKNKQSNLYDVSLTFENYENNFAQLTNPIKSIIHDSDNNLWLGTNDGLLKFDQTNNTISDFNKSNGFNSDVFNSNSVSKSTTGNLIFGTLKGPVIFKPDEINLSSFNPKIVFTDFLIFNKSVLPGENSPIKKSISITDKIILSYNQNVFTFKFAALDFNSSEQINYKYKLEGFDDEWISSGINQFATYTNLNEGTYYFKVKATNSDGQWSNNVAMLILSISAPWWRSFWAYIIYVLVIGSGLYAIRRFEINRSKLRDELRLRDLESKKLREIEKIKSRFFTNLSHEFRTPLMLIKGPVEQLLSGNNINQSEQIKLIQRNSDKLQNLIDQLLELSQLEASSIELSTKKENLVSIVRGIFYSFSELAERKKITMKFYSVSDKIITWVDRDKFEKILNNLLSNAFKFTPENGEIGIEVVNTSIDYIDYSTISIKDSGIGIPADKVEKIFDRFFQVDDSSKRAYGGSGIGLSLVKELVDLHKWKIFVHSKEGIGTEFILQVPLDENYLGDAQKLLNQNENLDEINLEVYSATTLDNSIDPIFENDVTSANKYTGSKKSTVLIVEDSEDVRIYLQDILKQDYDLLISENGEKGLSEALEKLPDLIISDVMMPIMDGIEFCKKIKSDWKTSHIPVILLTAKATTESKIEGLEIGADDYVTKPFSFRELSIRIKNLLNQRKVLKEKFGKSFNIPIDKNSLSKADQEFFDKATMIVEQNISNTEFDSDIFSRQIFLSRSQLHRKINAITGQSTGEFIRTIRLKKAAQLILDKKLSVTQIAFEVGFNSPSHFSKAFKQMFDCLPSEFVNRVKN